MPGGTGFANAEPSAQNAPSSHTVSVGVADPRPHVKPAVQLEHRVAFQRDWYWP
jgi:hypothetical protein